MGKPSVRARGRNKAQAAAYAEEKAKKRQKTEEEEERELEEKCEMWCGRIITLCMLIGPTMSLLSSIGEYVTRPLMIVKEMDLTDRDVIITGGTDGMGAELAMLMAQSRARVVLGCRNVTKGNAVVQRIEFETGNENVQAWRLEMDSFKSVRAFAKRYVDEGKDLHVLVNNAGTSKACTTTDDGHEYGLQVNYLSHFLLTDLLLPTLKLSAPSRIVHVTCPAAYEGFIEDELQTTAESCKAHKQYSNSKLMQIAFSNELQRRLKSEYLSPCLHLFGIDKRACAIDDRLARQLWCDVECRQPWGSCDQL